MSCASGRECGRGGRGRLRAAPRWPGAERVNFARFDASWSGAWRVRAEFRTSRSTFAPICCAGFSASGSTKTPLRSEHRVASSPPALPPPAPAPPRGSARGRECLTMTPDVANRSEIIAHGQGTTFLW
jgi:hypothetical protein